MRNPNHSLRESARDYALRVLSERIISLDLEPGSMVSEKELAIELTLSRTPVREALIELGKSQIVEIVPQKGSFIAKIDYGLVDESQFIRLCLEKGIIEYVCSLAEDEDFLNLEENIRLQEFYLQRGDNDKFFEVDNQFHKLLFDIAEMSQAYYLMESMQIHFDRVRKMRLHTQKELTELLNDHKNILEALQQRDEDRAVMLMTLHLSRYRIDKEDIQAKYCQYFCEQKM